MPGSSSCHGPLVDKPYDFSLTAADGSALRSPGLKGKVVLIDCWESRDGSYADRVSSLKRYYDRHRSDGFEVIGLNFDRDRANAERLVKARALSWPQVFVPAGDLRTLRLWSEGPGLPQYPRFLLMDREGILRWDGADPQALEAANQRSDPGAPRQMMSNQDRTECYLWRSWTRTAFS